MSEERRDARATGARGAALNGFYRTARWIEGHVDGFFGAFGVYIGVAFGVAVLLMGIFVGIAKAVNEGVTQGFDESIMRWMNAHGNPTLDNIALEVTSLGSTLHVVLLMLVASAFLWVTRHRWTVALLWLALAGSTVLNLILKASFERPRPNVFPWLDNAGFFSFPSGHAMTSTVVYGTLAYLVARLEPGVWMRRLTFGLAVALILTIGLSRIYLGVHYPSDVIAGMIGGFAWATTCAFGLEMVRILRSRRPGTEREEKGLKQGMKPVQEAVANSQTA
jgi:undecaprenyl-diphosphatase